MKKGELRCRPSSPSIVRCRSRIGTADPGSKDILPKQRWLEYAPIGGETWIALYWLVEEPVELRRTPAVIDGTSSSNKIAPV